MQTELRGKALFDSIMSRIKAHPEQHDQRFWAESELRPYSTFTATNKKTGENHVFLAHPEETFEHEWLDVVDISSLLDKKYVDETAALRYLEQHYEFSPSTGTCGTAYCLAGTAVAQSGAKLLWLPYLTRPAGCSEWCYVTGFGAVDCVLPDGTVKEIPQYAGELLGLSAFGKSYLFASGNSVADLERLGAQEYQDVTKDVDVFDTDAHWDPEDDDVE